MVVIQGMLGKLYALCLVSILLSILIGYMLANYDQWGHYGILISCGLLFIWVYFGVRHIYLAIKNKSLWFEQILDCLPTPLSITDMDMNWTYINKPVEKLFKQPKKSFIGRQCSNWGAAICKTENCGITRLRNGETETFFSQFDREFRVDTHYLYDLNQRPIGHVEVCTDITSIVDLSRAAEREKEQKLKLEDSYSELKVTQQKLVQTEKMASLGQLVAGIAHEVNTPLGTCVTAASMMRDSTKDFQEKIKSNKISLQNLKQFTNDNIIAADLVSRSLERTVNLISTFKQVAIDNSADDSCQFNLADHLRQFIQTMESELKENDIEITVNCQLKILVESFPSALELVYHNLISNSLIHGGKKAKNKISINIYQKDHNIYIDYQDNGQGIEPAILSKVFEPFLTTKRSSGQTGLGLHIVYNLVTQRLKGDIICKNTPDSGANFIIEIPKQLEAVPIDEDQSAIPKDLLIETKVSFN